MPYSPYGVRIIRTVLRTFRFSDSDKLHFDVPDELLYGPFFITFFTIQRTWKNQIVLLVTVELDIGVKNVNSTFVTN